MIKPILRKRADDAIDGNKIGGTAGEIAEAASDAVIDAALDELCGPDEDRKER